MEPELVTLDKWFRPASEPVRAAPPVLPGYSVGALEPSLFEVPTMDTWYRPASEPVRAIPPVLPGRWAGVLEPSLFEIPTIDTWFRQPLPLPPAKTAPLTTGTFLTEPTEWPVETVTMDKWFRPASEPMRAEPWLPAAGAVSPLVQMALPSGLLRSGRYLDSLN